MKTTTIVSKLSCVLKSGLLGLLLFFTGNVYAEYYLAYSGCSDCYSVRYYHPVRYSCNSCPSYGGCYRGCYHYICSRAPYRHNHYDPYQEAEYQWIDP